MQTRVDAGEVVAATSRLQSEADAVRRLAASMAAVGHVEGGTLEGALAESMRVVGDICGDVLEVVGLDLDVLARKARAGAGAYDAIERAVLRAAGSSGRAGSPGDR